MTSSRMRGFLFLCEIPVVDKHLLNNNRVTVAVTSVEVNFTFLVSFYCKSRKKAPRFIVEIGFGLLDL